jgi:hypothetical protein
MPLASLILDIIPSTMTQKGFSWDACFALTYRHLSVLNFLEQEDSVLVSAHSSEDANAAGAGNLSKNLQTKAILYIYEKVPFRGSFNR